MFNIGIIDDEKPARKYILSLLDDFASDIKSIVEAKNSMDALEKFKEFKPDIIFADIRMPGIDGLELIHRLRDKINPNIKTIIVSGYSDFEYSREAIKLKVNDYLLKPIKQEEFSNVFTRVVNELKKDIMENTYTQQMKRSLRDKSILGLIENNQIQLNQLYELLPPDLMTEKKLGCLYIRVADTYDNSVYMKTSADSLCCMSPEVDYISHYFNKIILREYNGLIIKKDASTYIGITGETDPGKLDFIVNQFINNLSEHGLSVTVGSGTPQPANKINVSYIEAETASKEFLIKGTNRHYAFRYKPNNTTQASFNYQAIEKQIMDCMYLCKHDYHNLLRNILDISKYESYMHWELMLKHLLVSFQKLANENNINIDFIHNFKQVIDTLHNAEAVYAWLENNANELMRQISSKRNNCADNVINDCVTYIQQHFAEDLKIEYVAGIFHMNPTYFCEIFKKVTGKTFLEYVIYLRMQKARKLLKETPLKIFEVAERVGYNNANYFNRAYKKFFGEEPRKTRRCSDECKKAAH